MRIALALLVVLAATPVAADVMPSPGRPDFPDTPQPEPAPIPLEASLALVAMAGGALLLSRQARQPT